jgi:hypothetical protein
MDLSNEQLTILAELLDIASDEFCNHGCNDFDIKNTPENVEMIKHMYGEDEAEDFLEGQGNEICTNDWMLMDYFKRKIEAEINKK